MNQKFYRVELEDPATPIGCNKTKLYFGTLKDIYNVIRQMESDGTHPDTVQAFEEFLEGNNQITHNIGGHEVQLITPVEMIALEKLHLSNYEWDYEDHFGCTYHLRAELILIQQVLLRDGDMCYRCIRPQFMGLQMKGTYEDQWRKPHLQNEDMSRLMLGGGVIALIPYVVEQETADIKAAMAAMWREDKLDFTAACGELFGRA